MNLDRLKQVYLGCALIFLNTFLCFVMLNVGVLAYSIFDRDALDVPSDSDTRRYELNRLGGVMTPHEELEALYPDIGLRDIGFILLESANGLNVCDDETGFRRQPIFGDQVSVHEAGFRYLSSQRLTSQPWPPDEDAFNIFVFGGSTIFGFKEREYGTVPAWLQAQLGFEYTDQDVYVYNFGNPGHRIINERLRFGKLLDDGFVPDVAIFVDGLNDFGAGNDNIGQLYRGDCVTRVTNAFDSSGVLWNTLDCEPDALCLPLFALAQNMVGGDSNEVSDLFTEEDIATETDDYTFEEQSRDIIASWADEKAEIEALAAEHDIDLLFVMQPIPFYAYDLNNHRLPPEIMLGMTQFSRHPIGYEIWDTMYQDESTPWRGNVVNLVGMAQDNTDLIYVDTTHYSYLFMQEMAWNSARKSMPEVFWMSILRARVGVWFRVWMCRAATMGWSRPHLC